MTGVADALDSETVKVALVVPLLPSVSVTSEMLSPGAVTPSSLVMVPVALAWASVAPVGLVRVTVKVSLGSTTVSPRTLTATVWEVVPAAKVRVPVAAV